MNLDVASTAQVAALEAKLDRALALLDALMARQEPRLADVGRVRELTGWCDLTIRRKFKRGELRGRRVGRRIMIDLDSLRPASDSTVAAEAAKAKR